MAELEPVKKGEARRFGLDVLRAVAVLSVVLGHDLGSVDIPLSIARLGRGAILGVELFYVLSGFLIGGLLIELVLSDRFRSPKDLLHFWGRRWLRTLPLYYLFLLLYYFHEVGSFQGFGRRLNFVLFLQNFAWPGPVFFRLAWSLCVEEYFYLLFPLLCFLLVRSSTKCLKALMTSVAFFLLVPLVLKALSPGYEIWDDFDWNLRQVVIFRLDSLMYGVGASLLFKCFPKVWEGLRHWTAVGYSLVLAVTLYFYFDYPGLLGSHWPQVFVFPILSLGFALLFPSFQAMKRPAFTPLTSAITYMSTISYSLYLSHILVLLMLKNECLRTVEGRAFMAQPLLYVPFLFVLSLLVASFFYYAWEYPFLWLRARFLPTERREAAWPGLTQPAAP